jgi:predicted DNA binding CopG/RHH family protein
MREFCRHQGRRSAESHCTTKVTDGLKTDRTSYAKATFRKDRRLNIRLSRKDLEAIQKRAEKPL